MRNRYLAASIACLLALLVLVGCGGGGKSSGTGSVSLKLTDAPLAGVEKVEVTISKIIVHKDGSGPIVLKEYATPVTVDLLQYRYDGTDSSTYPLLADTPLTTGHYTWVRLELTGASVTVNGVPHAIDMSNLTPRGIQFNRPFDVVDGDKVGLLCDFNAGKSVKQRQDGVYYMNPVTAMMPVVLAGSVSGKVEFKDANGNVVTVPDGATIDAYKTGDTTLANSGVIASDGTFAIAALEAGTYDLKVSATGYSETAVVKSGVTVTSGDNTDAGTITVTP